MLQGEKNILQNLPLDESVVGTDLTRENALFLKRKNNDKKPKIMQKTLNPKLTK